MEGRGPRSEFGGRRWAEGRGQSSEGRGQCSEVVWEQGLGGALGEAFVW